MIAAQRNKLKSRFSTNLSLFFFFQAEDGIRDGHVTGVQTCALPISPAAAEDSTTDTKADDVTENDVAYDGSPVVIREKKHPASPMTVDDALYRMEMVGHDFFLFIDSETSNPKVVRSEERRVGEGGGR